jgi:hypothetical protein
MANPANFAGVLVAVAAEVVVRVARLLGRPRAVKNLSCPASWCGVVWCGVGLGNLAGVCTSLQAAPHPG